MKKLIIIGVSSFAREVYGHAKSSKGYMTEWILKGFLNGDMKRPAEEYEKLMLPVLGDVYSYVVQPDDVFICAFPDEKLRRRFTEAIMQKGGTFINLISNLSYIQDNVVMGNGNIICPYVVLNDHAKLGDFTILNIGVRLGHDSSVGNYSSLMGGVTLCGFATVGEDSYMATNAVAIPHSQIGNNCYVGVGSVVFKRVRDGMKVFGNPAMPIDF